MAKEQVQIVFSANSEQARALFDEIARGQDRVGKETDKASSKMTNFGSSIESLAKKYVSLAAVVGVATQALTRHNEELQKSADTSRNLEDIIGRVATQAGMPRGSEAGLTRQIGGIASRNAATMDMTAGAVEQLISSGFSSQNVLEGGVADVFLQSMHALNASGKDQDPKEMARAMARFLKGTGQNLDAKSMQGLAVPLFNLFQNTDVQAADLSFLGAKASPLTQLGRMSPNEILAAFSVIKDVKGASEASTSFGSLVSRLASGSGDAGITKTLGQMGMKPGDVDFVGEDFLSVLTRLRSGVNSLPEGARAGALKQIAGQENLDTLTTFLANIDTIRSRQGGLGATGVFQSAAARRMGGLGARERQMDVRRSVNVIEEGDAFRARALRRADRFESVREQYGTGAAMLMQELIDAAKGVSAGAGESVPRPEITIKLPNQTRVPGIIKATESLEGKMRSAAGMGGGLN